MLFNYRYVSHSIEGFQLYLDHLVKDVWCNANADFSLDMLHNDLKHIILDIYDVNTNTTRGNIGDWLYGPILNIYNIFKNLGANERNKIRSWYDNNNDIESLCVYDPLKIPATYSDIRSIDSNLAVALKAFCQSLFKHVIHLSAVTSRLGTIDNHYEAFIRQNGEGKCPYCGYGDIKGLDHSYREAYDHFLPKGTYPFNSVNFRNLAPMCHECNSTYKLAKDPTMHIDPIKRKSAGTRRKAFYSYAAIIPSITIIVTLNTKDINTLTTRDIGLQLTSPGYDEEVEAWKDIFGIDERYKAKFCGKNDGKAWLQHIVEESLNGGLTQNELLSLVIRAADRCPYDSANFLKKAFLQACRNARII